MKLTIDVIDADPAEFETIAGGYGGDYQRLKIKGNKVISNPNVEKLADGIAMAIEGVLDGVHVGTEHDCIRRNAKFSFVSEIVVSGVEGDNDSELEKLIWDILAVFSGTVSNIIECREYPLYPLQFPTLESEEMSQILDELCQRFIRENKLKRFSRSVVVRLNKEMRVTVGGEWKKAPVGKRVLREHPRVEGIVTQLDITNRAISVQGGKSSGIKTIYLGQDDLDKLPLLKDMFQHKSFFFEVENHYLAEQNDSELHMININSVAGS